MELNTIKYRQTLYLLLAELRHEMPPRDFRGLLKDLQSTIGELPVNNLESSRAFFTYITKYFFSMNESYFDIVHENYLTEQKVADRFYITLKEEYADMQMDYIEMADNVKFIEYHLKVHYPLIADNIARFKTVRFGGKSTDTDIFHCNVLEVNPFYHKSEIHLPYDYSNRPVGTYGIYRHLLELYEKAARAHSIYSKMYMYYDDFLKAKEDFFEKTRDDLNRRTQLLRADNLKLLLSRLIVPREEIHNPIVRAAMEEKLMDVLVLKDPASFHYPNSLHVHLIAGQDLANDADYEVRPFLSNLTADEILSGKQLLGVAQVTGLDLDAKRSLNGHIPVVVNDSIYASIQQPHLFAEQIPQALHVHYQESLSLLQSLGVQSSELNLEAGIDKKVFRELSLFKTLLYEETLSKGLTLHSYTKESAEPKEDDEPELPPNPYAFRENTIHAPNNMFTVHPRLPESYILYLGQLGFYYCIRMHSDGSKWSYTTRNQQDALQALQITAEEAVYLPYS